MSSNPDRAVRLKQQSGSQGRIALDRQSLRPLSRRTHDPQPTARPQIVDGGNVPLEEAGVAPPGSSAKSNKTSTRAGTRVRSSARQRQAAGQQERLTSSTAIDAAPRAAAPSPSTTRTVHSPSSKLASARTSGIRERRPTKHDNEVPPLAASKSDKEVTAGHDLRLPGLEAGP